MRSILWLIFSGIGKLFHFNFYIVEDILFSFLSFAPFFFFNLLGLLSSFIKKKKVLSFYVDL